MRNKISMIQSFHQLVEQAFRSFRLSAGGLAPVDLVRKKETKYQRGNLFKIKSEVQEFLQGYLKKMKV